MELTEVQKEADSAGRKAILFGIAALLTAGLFGWMLARLSGGGPETQAVVVAAEEIPPLTQLKAKQLKVVQWPAAALPRGTFAKPDDVVKTNQINVNGLDVGEPILASRLSTPERGLGMSQMVEPSMRAFVVQVKEHVAAAELLHPGAFVDVVATLEDVHSRELVTKVILQNVQVLAVGASIDVEPATAKEVKEGEERAKVERRRVVTLLVNLADVEELAFASQQGKLDLALRNNQDSELVSTEGATVDKMLGARPSKAEARPSVSQAAPPPVAPPRPSRSSSHPHPSSSPRTGPHIYKVPN
ncbi:MAG TPA: Flp pilus assembly protein CpaB [Myxococcota bacterium]|nr:Flp pilus assembly protein CpaB [Myxococcota bacterium]